MTEPWIASITATRWNRWLCRVLGVVTGAGAFVWWWMHTASHVPDAAVVATAVTVYTLYEYVVHRFFFHGRRSPALLRRGHGLHHRDPHAHLSMPFVLIAVQAVVLLTVAVAAFGPTDGPLFAAVFAAGYGVYGGLHTLVHRESLTWPWLVRAREVHQRHHDRPGRNFGVTTSLWDRVFGTWEPPSAVTAIPTSAATRAAR